MLIHTLRFTALLTFLIAAPLPANAQYAAPTPVSAAATATLTAKITAIDRTNRTITLQDDQGNVRDFQVGPNVKRFDQLKVGDTVTFTYQESVALAIVKAAASMPMASSTPVITSYPGSKPGGEITQTQTTTVTVQSIDQSKPSITVKTQDGRVITFAVQDPKNLNGLKPGDIVQVTYRQALVITVK